LVCQTILIQDSKAGFTVLAGDTGDPGGPGSKGLVGSTRTRDHITRPNFTQLNRRLTLWSLS